MSMESTFKVVKLIGQFDDISKLNSDLRKLTTSEFMDCLIESANDSGIQNVDLFGITTGYFSGKLGLISQGEGCVNNDYYEVTNTYIDLDKSMLQIISNHLTENSKLVLSITSEDGCDQTIYIITDKGYEVKELHELFV